MLLLSRFAFGFLLLLPFCWGCTTHRSEIFVATIAGTGTISQKDGPAREAGFGNLAGIAVDDSGNLYIADALNNKIRRLGKDGQVSTVAGTGAQGHADGASEAATFFYPLALAVDKSGNVFVADTRNNLIRKISGGQVRTIAGHADTLSHSHENSPRLDNPSGIAIDKAGSIFFSDWGNDQIRKIDSAGNITVYAGRGTPGRDDGRKDTASFYLPAGLALDGVGRLYVADCYNNSIRVIEPGGQVRTLAGQARRGRTNGKGSEASFNKPVALCVDPQGNVYVADAGNNLIRKITPEGIVSTLAGSGHRGSQDGRDTTASFFKPSGIAWSPKGTLHVADFENNKIREITLR